MSSIIEPGAGVLYMKVGTHAAGESGGHCRKKVQGDQRGGDRDVGVRGQYVPPKYDGAAFCEGFRG